ncbi:MAG: hypothetical protein LBB28_04475 [Synergistaceae bacterium]|nr:hypothetical protein [Synergistaceae bacterium]
MANSLRSRIGALLNLRGRSGRRDAAESSGGNAQYGSGRSDAAMNAAVEIAVESWRFGRFFEKIAAKLEGTERERCMKQLLSFNKKIENSLDVLELRMVNIEGTPFDPGIAATPLNIEDFKADDELVVDRMIEPIIMGKDGLIRVGRVTLRKTER